MIKLDALAKVVLNYIKERDGQVILMKKMESDTSITQFTLRRKIKFLIENNLIKRDGKIFHIVKE